MIGKRKTPILFLFRFESAFISHLCSALPRDALIDRYPVQPRGDLGFAPEGSQIPEGREKSLLGSIAGIFLASKHAKGKRKDSALPAQHNLAESIRVAVKARSRLLVARTPLPSVVLAGKPRV